MCLLVSTQRILYGTFCLVNRNRLTVCMQREKAAILRLKILGATVQHLVSQLSRQPEFVYHYVKLSLHFKFALELAAWKLQENQDVSKQNGMHHILLCANGFNLCG